MKKFAILFLVSALLFSACETPAPGSTKPDKTPGEDGPKSNPETVEVEVLNLEDISVDEISALASSVLVDDTNIGFNYEASMVLDQDFSTAWCSQAPLNESISLSLPLSKRGGVLGIVPGFAREEAIFFQNNRVKTLQVKFLNGEEVVSESKETLEDSYKMQFIELPEEAFDKINFEILATYPGSKYKDSCIAEIDLLSDYVLSPSADGAMNFYQENKAGDALRPYDIVGSVGAIDERNGNGKTCPGSYTPPSTYMGGEPWMNQDTWAFYGDQALWLSDTNHVVASINDFGRVGDELTVKWYFGGTLNYLDENDNFQEKYYDWSLMKTSNVKVFEGCDGKLYAHDKIAGDHDYYFVSPTGGGVHGEYMAQFWHKGKMVGSVQFNGEVY